MRLSSRYFRVAYTAIFVGVFLKQVRHIQITTANDFVWDAEDSESPWTYQNKIKLGSNSNSRPVYLVGNDGKLGIVDGAALLRWWQPNSSYESLHLTANAVTVMPFPQEAIIILHCFPKMASSSLRRACWESLRDGCGIISHKRDPNGYTNSSELFHTIGACSQFGRTRHFCVQGWHPHSFNDAVLENQGYIHMVPFRDFYNWSSSALKQIWTSHGANGCSDLDENLEDCRGYLELDFAKYSKVGLRRLIDELESRHTIVVYEHSKMRASVSLVSARARIPLNINLHWRQKDTRPLGSCPNETLSNFHQCYDTRL
mmetsp:Transcript_19641/g.46103  ORF Transcript_19641/g.46103 Transcript_19641/m.46103 type:complete len:315 (-) Transcript_19641:115-1059(-)